MLGCGGGWLVGGCVNQLQCSAQNKVPSVFRIYTNQSLISWQWFCKLSNIHIKEATKGTLQCRPFMKKYAMQAC